MQLRRPCVAIVVERKRRCTSRAPASPSSKSGRSRGLGRKENGLELTHPSRRAVSVRLAWTRQKGPALSTASLVHFPLRQTTVQSWHRLLPPCPPQRRLRSVICPNHPLPPSIRSTSLRNQILRIHSRRIGPGLLPAPSRLPLAASTPHQRLADRSGLSAVPRRSSTLLDLVSVSTDRCSAVDSRSLRSAS
jgi:hypothetical protein